MNGMTLPIPPRMPLPLGFRAHVETRSGLAAAFRAAKPYLRGADGDDEREVFICYALRLACQRHNSRHVSAAISVVSSRLARVDTYGTWLQMTAPDLLAAVTRSDPQRARHAWLDDLIAEFSEPAPC